MPDEYLLDTPTVRAFIATVRETMAVYPTPHEGLEALRPTFGALLADSEWLPASFQAGVAESGMGGGIATWLIYRAAEGDLSLFSLVVPPGSATPIHNHLAWGLVGLYAGAQDEEVFRLLAPLDAHHDGHELDEHAPLELVERNQIKPGDFYTLLPPEGDIHRVRTTSDTPSVSIHLLGNDTGCVWRQSFELEAQRAHSFRSGYSNRPCHEQE